MRRMKYVKRILSIVIFFLFSNVYAVEPYNPIIGGEEFPSLYSPFMMSSGLSSAGTGLSLFAPAFIAINPALFAGEENPILDLSYVLVSGIQKERGTGHIGNASFIYPATWGVLGGAINAYHVRLDSLNFGSSGSIRLAYSKDITDSFYIGAGAYAMAGSDWALGVDLGILYFMPDRSFFHRPRLGFSITGLGKPFNPKTCGVREEGSMLGFPSFFTPHIAFATEFVSIEHFNMGGYINLSAPAFSNLAIGAGIDMLIADILTLQTGYKFNLLETLKGKQTHIPSFGIALKFKINPKKTENKTNDNVAPTILTPQFAVKPFYNNIWAFAFGLTTKFGTEDKEAPKIELSLKDGMYISPNNDGRLDSMEADLKISDRRYISSWICEIKNEEGIACRHIANKRPIRELTSVSTFWKLLKEHKENIEVPKVLRWDGTLDSGDVAKDGKYYFTLEASDDNHNISKVGPYEVVVDNTPPQIEIEGETSSSPKIFSPDGDGNKDVFVIIQQSSKEDLWEGRILDAQENVVRTFNVENDSMANITWNGQDDVGKIVLDGVYSYVVHSKDRAGNETTKKLTNIIVDTNRPSLSLNIDRKFFSPNGDGIYDNISLIPKLAKDGLVKCRIEVKNTSGKTLHQVELSPNNIDTFIFDGKVSNGKVLDEGSYYAMLMAEYNNGYLSSAPSPSFVVDLTPPKASVRASDKIFSPDGDGKLDSVTFFQGASEDSWHANIFAISKGGKRIGLPLVTIEFANLPPKKIVWTGLDKNGNLLEDGRYGYVLEGIDEAGNKAESNMEIVSLNTEKANLILQSDTSLFSPNNDGIKDFLTFYPIIRSKTPISSYKLTIESEEDGSIVNMKEGIGEPPTRIVWRAVGDEETIDKEVANAASCKDGFYKATLEVELENKQRASSTVSSIEIDRTYPSITVNVPYLVFSPQKDSKKKSLPIKQTSSKEELWVGIIKNEKGEILRTIKWQGVAQSFEWDALDEAGNRVPNGRYFYEVSAKDKAGNYTKKTISNIEVDDRSPKLYITQELSAISPNDDGFFDAQTFSIHTNLPEGIEKWSLYIQKIENAEDGGQVVSNDVIYLNKNTNEKLPKTISWDGKKNDFVIEGNFVAHLEVEYAKGDVVTAESAKFLSSITPPKLKVSLKPRYFSPDDDGIDDELFIGLEVISSVEIESWHFDISEPIETGGKHFWSTQGKAKISNEIIWDGRSSKGEVVQSATDYPFTFTVQDSLHLSSTTKGYIPVDILIVRDGDKLKIAVPSIIFRPNADDFEGLSNDVVSKNAYVLKRVAQILNKFTNYQVQVEGHANSTTGTEEEETKDLIPLSTLRAKAVMQILIKNGVRASRLSAIGMGGSKPVAPLDDRDNWWKNRRVEFVLIK